MKRLPILFAALLFATGTAAQNPTAYFMEGSTFRTQFNPAFAPLRGYINLPVAGRFEVGLSSSLALSDVLYPRDGKLVTLFDRSVSTAEALRGLKPDNIIGTETSTAILSFGKFASNRKHFWAFDINLRGSAEIDLPKSLIRFVKCGDEGVVRNFGAAFDSYVDAGFTYSFPLLGDKLYVGAKAKFVMGLARAKVNFDRMDITLNEERWAVQATGNIDANIPGAEVDYRLDDRGRPYFELGDIDMGSFKPAGYGFALDLGATYDVLRDLQVSLAVTDLGFISWNAAGSVRGTSHADVEYTGITVENGTAASSPDFSFDDILRFNPSGEQGRARMMHASLHAGAEYFVWNHRVGFGLLYRARFQEYKTLHSLTGSVNFSPVDWFTLAASYTVAGGRGNSLGLALNFCPGWINFFVGTDLTAARFSPQFIPVDRRAAHVTFGLGFPLGKRGLRDPRASNRK